MVGGGKLVEGQRLLFLFAILMIVVGVTMLAPRASGGEEAVRLNRRNLPQLAGRRSCTWLHWRRLRLGRSTRFRYTMPVSPRLDNGRSNSI
jgi:hypothetical protein